MSCDLENICVPVETARSAQVHGMTRESAKLGRWWRGGC